MAEHKFIYRHDREGPHADHGWIVFWTKNGDWRQERKTKYFADKKNGGKRKALKNAKEFRDNKYEELGLSEMLKSKKVIKYHNLSNSGVIGIGLRGKGDTRAWYASGSKDGESWSTSFNIKKHGEKRAFLLACFVRYKKSGILQITGKLSDLPCRPTVPFNRMRKKRKGKK
jgi:hypothetical protein